jgi:hypothetical protein
MKFAFELIAITFLSVATSSSVLAFAPASLFSAKNTNTNSVVDSKVGQRWLKLQAYNDDGRDSVGNGFGVDIDDAVARYGRTGRRRNRKLETIDDAGVGGSRGRDLDDYDCGPSTDSSSNTSSNAAPAKATAAENDDRFDLPEVSGKSHSLLISWKCGSVDRDSIEVVLVSQWSLDRLSNLKAQLACWTGKASIAVYLKPSDNKLKAYHDILSTIKKAKTNARNNKRFDVVVTIVEGCMEEEPYPINYLRNVALLEAQKQHLKFSASLDQSAALLGEFIIFFLFLTTSIKFHNFILTTRILFVSLIFLQWMLIFSLVAIYLRCYILKVQQMLLRKRAKLLCVLLSNPSQQNAQKRSRASRS